jgi:hypothetical protein
MCKLKSCVIVVVLLLLYACSSTSFYQRQYLSGRYVDKIDKPEKVNSNTSSEFNLQEFPLSADLKSNISVLEINEDTIPKTAVDTTKNNTEAKQDEVIYFSPDTLKNIKKDDNRVIVPDYKQQLIFNDKLKRAATKIFLSWLIRIGGFIGIFLYVIFSGPMLFSTVASIVVFGILLLLILFASLVHNYLAFSILLDADKMRAKNPELQNLGWYYFLLGLNIYFILIALYYLAWMLFYGAIILFFAML